MPTLGVGMTGDRATETSHAAPADKCDGRALIKHWLVVMLFNSASYDEKCMSEGQTQNIDYWKEYLKTNRSAYVWLKYNLIPRNGINTRLLLFL